MQMNIKFELGPKQRPKLVEEIAAALHTIPCYQRLPSCSYKIGDCTLENDDTLRIPDSVDAETVNRLLEHLREQGFTGSMEETEERLTISVPRDSFTETTLANLQKLIDNKAGLMARVFATEKLALNISEDEVGFTWFPFTTDPDEVSAYTEFVSRLCGMARDLKRVSGGSTETDNDKYAFRCFLLRLGFIGKEYKIARKILLRNLTGNSAFRYGK